MLWLNLLVCRPNLLGSESSAGFALGRIFLGPNLLPPLSSAVFQISSGIRGRPAEKGSGSNRMKKVLSSKSRRSAKVQIEGATMERSDDLSNKKRVSTYTSETLRYIYKILIVNG